MSFFEISGNIVTVLCVFLAARNHILTWPTGIIGCVLYGVMFYQSKLYADVTLQVFFIITSLIGWWNWRKAGPAHHDLPITRTTRKALFLFHIPVALVTAAAYGAILHTTTDASFPFLDSAILTFSVIGQLQLMARKLECWYFWIIVDCIAVPLYAAKDLYITSAVYTAFLINAVYGYIAWKREFKKQSHAAL